VETRDLIKQELEIKLGELEEKWHFRSSASSSKSASTAASRNATTWEAVIAEICTGLKPFVKNLRRESHDEDLVRLTEIRIKRISKFDSFKADEYLRGLEDQIAETKKNLKRLTAYTIKWYEGIKERYGKGRKRRTELSTFDRVDAKQVVVANDTLYVDRKEGFAGYGMKRDEAVCKCSRMDDIIAFSRDGTMRVVKVAEKVFVGKDNLHVAVFNRDEAKDLQHDLSRWTRWKRDGETLPSRRGDAREALRPHRWSRRHTRFVVLRTRYRRGREPHRKSSSQK
jgi:topoisomerase-4 subunit A